MRENLLNFTMLYFAAYLTTAVTFLTLSGGEGPPSKHKGWVLPGAATAASVFLYAALNYAQDATVTVKVKTPDGTGHPKTSMYVLTMIQCITKHSQIIKAKQSSTGY